MCSPMSLRVLRNYNTPFSGIGVFLTPFARKSSIVTSFSSRPCERWDRLYLSDLTVVKNGKDVVHKIIRVNDPLHFGGYHFYQHSYNLDSTPTTILSITSDSGLYAAFAGYLALCLGAIWHFWIDAAVRHLRQKRNQERGSA